MTKEQKKKLLKAQQSELNSAVMYQMLAKKAKDPEVAESFVRFAQEEEKHAAIFQDITQEKLTPKKFEARVIVFLMHIIGWRTLLQFIAEGEYNTEKSYDPLARNYSKVRNIQREEHRRGDKLIRLKKNLKK